MDSSTVMIVHSLGKKIPWPNKKYFQPQLSLPPRCVGQSKWLFTSSYFSVNTPLSSPLWKDNHPKIRRRWRRDETELLVFIWRFCINVSWSWESWIESELHINFAPKVEALNETVRGLPDLGGRQTGVKLFLCTSYSLFSQQKMVS